MMREAGHGRAQRPEEQHLAGRVGEMVVAADDVRDTHVTIVDDRREVVAGDAVGAHDDEVAHGVGADDDGTTDEVVDDDVALRDAEAQSRRLAGGKTAPYLSGIEAEAAPVVPRRAAFGERRRAELRKALLGAETVVRVAAGEQLVGGGPVTAKPLALAVRRARPAHVWALVPVEAEPAQVGEDGVLVPVVRARGVRVVDAQHEVAARVSRAQEVEQRRARRTDVQRACRTRCEADSYPRLKAYGRSLGVIDSPANRLQSII